MLRFWKRARGVGTLPSQVTTEGSGIFTRSEYAPGPAVNVSRAGLLFNTPTLSILRRSRVLHCRKSPNTTKGVLHQHGLMIRCTLRDGNVAEKKRWRVFLPVIHECLIAPEAQHHRPKFADLPCSDRNKRLVVLHA